MLRHTSGLTYGVFGNSPAKRKLKESEIGVLNNINISLEEYVKKLATFPLAHEPRAELWKRSVEGCLVSY